MYSLAWLVVVGVVGAILGGWLGHLVARVRSKAAARIQELEAELESARGESSEYRREVFDQFAETARKFKSLDESYNDLHRQLAASASLLCGEAAGPLLEAPPAPAAIAEAPEATAAAPAAATPAAAEPAAPETAAPEAPAAEQPAEVPAEEPAKAAEESADAQADEEVPILVAEVAGSGGAQVNGEETASDEPTDELQPRRAGDAG